MTPKRKKISKSDIIGDQGIALIHQRVSAMGFLWHPTRLEAGIDGWIELRDDQTGEVTGHFVPVQSKAADTNRRFTAETDTSFEFLCDERDLGYWLSSNAPIVIVVSRPNEDEAYWACITDRFRDLTSRKARRICFDKKRDRFDVNSAHDIAKLAIAKNSGFYLAAPPKKERLYSNLLGLSQYASRIFIAQTDLRFPSQVWQALKEFTTQALGAWVLTDKTLVSFHDLAEEPWQHLCDRGTVEGFHSDEFAFAEDDRQASLFANLLYVTLKDALWANYVRYDKLLDHYYFLPNTDLTPKTFFYQALENKTSRIVVGPYYGKKDPSTPRFYRHNAFQGRWRRFEQGWYLEIVPTYRFTSDGQSLYPWYEDLLSGIKRLENNQAVLGQVVMWSRLLGRPPDMFDKDPFLIFGELKTFDLDAGLFDTVWLPQEDPETPDEDDSDHDDDSPFTLLEL
jgi:Domain of unknown function (DUF4365)